MHLRSGNAVVEVVAHPACRWNDPNLSVVWSTMGVAGWKEHSGADR